MTDQKGKGNTVKRIALATLLVAVILSGLTAFFVHEVKTQLWEQSVGTIMESTQQGCNTLQIQLQDSRQSMQAVASVLEEHLLAEKGAMEELLAG